MPRAIFPFDELNALKFRISEHFNTEGRMKSKKDVEDIIDEMLDLFLLAYANGVDAISEQFAGQAAERGVSGEQFRESLKPSAEDLEKCIYQKIDGKTWEKRVWDWFDEGGTETDIFRIVETEAHRIGNTAADVTAKKAGAKEKVWQTMMDDKVRDTHFYLQSISVPVDGRFYTYDGDSARFPGDFTLAENNCNCRCELEYR